MRNFKMSFILQFLSPKLMRDLNRFACSMTIKRVPLISGDSRRGRLSCCAKRFQSSNLSNREPNIQVYNVDVRGDRALTLHHTRHNRMPLEERSAKEVLRHIHRLWGFDVRLYS